MKNTHHHHTDEKATESLKETLFQGQDPLASINGEKIKQWSDQATDFVQKNPWVAVAGALALGYFLGSFRRHDRGEG